MTEREMKRLLNDLQYLRREYERARNTVRELEQTSKITASYKNEPMGSGEVSSQPEQIALKIMEEIEKQQRIMMRYMELKREIEDCIDLYISNRKIRLALKYYYIDNKPLYLIKDKLGIRSDAQYYRLKAEGIKILCSNYKQNV